MISYTEDDVDRNRLCTFAASTYGYCPEHTYTTTVEAEVASYDDGCGDDEPLSYWEQVE